MDEQHIKEILWGDTESFRFIIRKYKDLAYSVAISIVKEEHHANEVVQEAFVKAFYNLGSFSGKAKFSSWLFRIVVNEAFKNRRKMKKNFQISAMPTEFNALAIDEFSLKEEEEERKYLVNEALNRLSPKESLALRLFYIKEANLKEIREITGWSISNIKVILFRARKNMKKLLSTYLKQSKHPTHE